MFILFIVAVKNVIFKKNVILSALIICDSNHTVVYPLIHYITHIETNDGCDSQVVIFINCYTILYLSFLLENLLHPNVSDLLRRFPRLHYKRYV